MRMKKSPTASPVSLPTHNPLRKHFSHSSTIKMNCCFFSILASLLPSLFAKDPLVDVAFNKPVWANLTCGHQGPERFFSQQFTGTQSSTHLQICASTNTYPSTNINDGNDQTWWQSSSRLSFVQAGFGVQEKPDAVIFIDLLQDFQAELIAIRFGESLRPGRMLVQKQTSTGRLLNWFYRVTSAMDCKNLYNLPVASLPTSLESIPCSPYTTPAVLEEMIQFDFSLTPAAIKAWNTVKAIRIEFFDIDLTLGVSASANEFQHYTVRSVNVYAKCSCNGQLTDCLINNTTNRSLEGVMVVQPPNEQPYECVCGGFTMGTFCESCLPLYNNKAYQYATTCEVCSCNNKSSSCVYDPIRLTGVCNACSNFTSGINCETCIDGYYRPAGVLPTEPSPCKPCECSGTFSTGQCLKTADAALFPGMSPGDCICQPNVVGKLCDTCKVGSHDISSTGCKDCACHANGTVASSTACDAEGQCACKRFVTGLKCDQCLDGFFNLDPSTPDGCIACNCDPGGSVNQVCDKITGVCQCKLGVKERACTSPMSGYFHPEFDFFSAEMENLESPWEKSLPGFSGFGYVVPRSQNPVYTSIDLTSINKITSNSFRIVVRFFSSVAVSGTLGVGANGVISQTIPFTVAACSDSGQWCSTSSEPLQLTPGVLLSVSFVFPLVPDNAKLSLDRVSAVPSAFFNASDVLPPTQNDDFLSKCKVLVNNLNPNTVQQRECSQYAFSIYTHLLNGAMLCACNGVGSNGTDSCNPAGGQCFCKPFVTSRKCDRCLPKYYSLSAAGCLQCNCSSTSYDMCDPFTGTCLCPPGSQGATCAICQLNHYNWDQVKGCLSCGCNSMGSTSLACDVATGTCACKAGVTGIKCDQCLDGFWRMSFRGCESCQCDSRGSISTTCDKSTGACQCKANTQGQWCNTCKLNSFSMTPFSPDGCLQCTCMGVSSTCSSSNFITPSFNLNPSSSSLFLVDSKGNPYAAVTPSVDPVTDMSSASIPPLTDLYWTLPEIKGNLLSIYGLGVSWRAQWTSAATALPAVVPQNPAVVVIGRNDERFMFQISNFTTPLAGQTTAFEAKLVLTSISDFQLASITREKILLALSDVKALLIPAVFTQGAQKTSIRQVELTLDASLVESCLCPVGYEGRSCERCSVGFTRANVTTQGFLGTCSACACNGKATTCNADTGECENCQQATTGFSCEECLAGHYRDPLDGLNGRCRICPCEGPRVRSNDCAFVDNVLTCLNCTEGYMASLCNVCKAGYYGDLSRSLMDSCRPCLCNGYSTVCDLSGKCINCSNSTTGDNCESCITGKYLDPITKQCVDCNCNSTASVSSTCDAITGKCSCKPGVASRACDQCMPNYHQFSSTGCLDCMCNQYGSKSLQCDEKGVCPCSNNTIADKCTSCSAGFYGISNNRSCELCDCDPLGTVKDDLFACDATTGQCRCNANVVGRRCDKCKPLYYSLTEILNCINCGRCETSLGEDIIAMNSNSMTQFQPILKELSSLQVQDAKLSAEQVTLDGHCSLLGSCRAGANVYEQFKNNVSLMMIQANQWKARADSMSVQATTTNAILQQLNDESQVILSSVQALKQQADQIHREHASHTAIVNADLSRLSASNESAFILWREAPYNASTFVSIPWTHGSMFDAERLVLNALSTRVSSLATRADALNAQLTPLVQQTTSMRGEGQAAQNLFATTSSELLQLNTTITGMQLNLATLASTINNALNIKASADSNFQRVQGTVLSTGASLQSTTDNLALCQQTLAQTNNLIYGNWTVSPPVYDQTGFRGWAQGNLLLKQLLQNSRAAITSSQAAIGAVEQQAVALATTAATITSAYEAVRGRGQAAVDVVGRFERVIKDLQASIVQSSSLNSTLQTLLNYLRSVPVPQLLTQAGQVLSSAQQLQNSVQFSINTTNTIDLDTQLEAARLQFRNSVDRWTGIDSRLSAFNKEYQDLQTFANDVNVKLSSDYNSGTVKADAVTAKINLLKVQQASLSSGLDTLSKNIDQVSSNAAQSFVNQNRLAANMSTFRVLLEQAAKTSLTTTNTSQAAISSQRVALQSKFSKADDMLKEIKTKIASMELPVYFLSNTFEQVANPDVDQAPMHNSLSLQFMFPQTARGVLLFVENNLSNEKLLLQLLNSTVCFAVANAQSSDMVCNYAQLNAKEWYKVYATRYGMDLKLVVRRQLTGGVVAVSSTSSLTSSLRISLNSPIYVGGLALNSKNIQKVFDSGVGFNGCVFKVSFNGAPIPLWQNILKTDSSATCCKKPPVTTFNAVITPCRTFHSFGYLLFNPSADFNLKSDGQIYMQFRTFLHQGVVLMASTSTSQDYYAVFVQNSRVLFAVYTQNKLLSLLSDLTYVNGQWYQLTVTHTTSKLSLRLDSTGETPANMEFKETTSTIDLSSLSNVPLLLGGQHTSYTRGPVTTAFSGHIKDFKHTTTSSSLPVASSLTVNSSLNVDLTSCLAEVSKGLAIRASGFATVLPSVAPIQTIDFTFITDSFSGILCYAPLEQTPANLNTFLYVALYNGDIFVLFDQGGGVQPATRTRNLKLADGRLHRVSLHFGFVNSPRLKVDNLETHVGAVSMSAFMKLRENRVYVGGVPSTTRLDTDVLPVEESLQGAFSQMKINDVEVPFMDDGVVTSSNSKQVDLSGIMGQRPISLPPCNPCPATPSTLTCVIPPPPSSTYDEGTFSFGDHPESFLEYSVLGKESYFVYGFVFQLQFRSLQPDGLMLYIANSPSTFLSDYFAVYLHRGYLNAVLMNSNIPKSVVSKKTYYDGNWHSLSVFRVGDFLAILVEDSFDYNNNNQDSGIRLPMTNLVVNSPLYVGGVPLAIPLFPPSIPIGKAAFKGCISGLSIQSQNYNIINLPPSEIVKRANVGLCTVGMQLGMLMTSSNSYVRASDSYNPSVVFNLAPSFSISLTFKTSSQNGVLMVAWSSSSSFVSLSLVNGQFQLILGSSTQPFVLIANPFKSAFDVCNNLFHTVSFSINTASVTLGVDTTFTLSKEFNGFIYSPPLSVPIYLGGVKEPTWSVPNLFSGNSLSACIQKCVINNNVIYITDSPELKNALSGCN